MNLSTYQDLLFLYRELKTQHAELQEKISDCGMGSSVISDMPKAATINSIDLLIDLIDASEKLRKRLEVLFEQIRIALAELKQYIATIDNPIKQRILWLKYVDDCTDGEIMQELNISRFALYRALKNNC